MYTAHQIAGLGQGGPWSDGEEHTWSHTHDRWTQILLYFSNNTTCSQLCLHHMLCCLKCHSSFGFSVYNELNDDSSDAAYLVTMLCHKSKIKANCAQSTNTHTHTHTKLLVQTVCYWVIPLVVGESSLLGPLAIDWLCSHFLKV